jgi:uncharacterized protein YjbI with pentapeptide repeats
MSRLRCAPASAAAEPSKPAKDEELDAIKKAVDDAASVGGGLWLSYLFVLFYLAVAAGAVTHADLFLENPVKLPFLNIELPLLAFFFLAPILFIVVHAYTLVHLVMLTDKAKRFHEALHDSRRKVDAAARESLQWQLPSNIFIQFLVGPPGIRGGPFGVALRAIAWITLVIAPVLLLLTMQVQFLPFHSSFITWTQRIALIVDLLLLGWLWRKILSGRELGGPFRASWAWPIFGFALALAVILFSWTVATFPGEWQEAQRSGSRVSGFPYSLHDWAFDLPFDPATGRRRSLLSNTLVLPDLNIYDGLKIDDPEKIKWRKFVFVASRRDLRGAVFDGAVLPRVDFTGADLRGASLWHAQVQSASFDFAQLQGALLRGAHLQGATFQTAQLQGASLELAHLQGALLVAAQLQGASLDDANLEGALLDLAELQGASLYGTELQGASLENAQLEGSSLELAHLQATDLWDAFLWRSNRSSAPPGFEQSKAPQLGSVRFSKGSDIWLPLWQDLMSKKSSFNFETAYPTLRQAMDYPALLLGSDSEPVLLWNENTYQDLLSALKSIPSGILRDLAMDRIRSLDCGEIDKTLASCETSAPLPPEASAWRKSIEEAGVEYLPYTKALAAVAKTTICSGDDASLDVLRGMMRGISARAVPITLSRLESTGPEAPALVDFIMSKDCPVSTSMTDGDKADLLSVKQDALRKLGG